MMSQPTRLENTIQFSSQTNNLPIDRMMPEGQYLRLPRLMMKIPENQERIGARRLSPQKQGLLVRAFYDCHADDPASLKFSKGDTIAVFTKLESGWWDGVHQGVGCDDPAGDRARLASHYRRRKAPQPRPCQGYLEPIRKLRHVGR